MKRIALLIAAIAAVAGSPLAAQAGVRVHGRGAEPPPVLFEVQDRLIPLPQIIAQLRGRGGEYVSANVTEQGGRTVYWIRMRHPGGRFVDYVVDARTGQILSEQGG